MKSCKFCNYVTIDDSQTFCPYCGYGLGEAK